MGVIKEFKEFAVKGNVLDMAIGIIIGGAFGKIVTSILNDILMPPLGLLIGGTDFTDLKVIIKDKTIDVAGNAVAEVSVNYGNFIQTLIDFTLVAIAVFMIIKVMNRIRAKLDAAPKTPSPPTEPTKEEKLLTEIRDILKNK
jgi:large conductance mechanosensitive channel